MNLNVFAYLCRANKLCDHGNLILQLANTSTFNIIQSAGNFFKNKIKLKYLFSWSFKFISKNVYIFILNEGKIFTDVQQPKYSTPCIHLYVYVYVCIYIFYIYELHLHL